MRQDNDGLTNAEEATLGADPKDADSDGDGVDDGDEEADGIPDNDQTLLLTTRRRHVADEDNDGVRDDLSIMLRGPISCAQSGSRCLPVVRLLVAGIFRAAQTEVGSAVKNENSPEFVFVGLDVVLTTLSAWGRANFEEVPSIPADAFRPALDANGFLDVEWGYVSGAKALDAALFSGYTLNPLVLGYRDGESAGVREAILVGNRVGAHLVASYGLTDWLQLGLDMPMVLMQNRGEIDTDNFGSITNTPLAVAGLGDLRLKPKIQAFTESTFGVDMALITTVTVPTNTPEAGYLGEKGFTFVPEMAFGRRFNDFRLLSNIGARVREQDITVGGLTLIP